MDTFSFLSSSCLHFAPWPSSTTKEPSYDMCKVKSVLSRQHNYKNNLSVGRNAIWMIYSTPTYFVALFLSLTAERSVFKNCLHKLFLDQFTIWIKWFEHLWQKKDLRPYLARNAPTGYRRLLYFSVFIYLWLLLHRSLTYCSIVLLPISSTCFLPACRKAWQTVISSTCQRGLINKQTLNHMIACL